MAYKIESKDKFNSPVQELIGEVHDILNDETGIDANHKLKIKALLDQADFLIGKYDERYEKFDQVLLAMATLDFSKRLSVDSVEEEPFFICLSNALNMLNEEFHHIVMPKNLVDTAFRALRLPDCIVILTDAKGKIKFLSNELEESKGILSQLSEKVLKDQSINMLFENYSIIEKSIEQKAAIHELAVNVRWEGKRVPASLSVSVSNTKGRIEGLVYIIKL